MFAIKTRSNLIQKYRVTESVLSNSYHSENNKTAQEKKHGEFRPTRNSVWNRCLGFSKFQFSSEAISNILQTNFITWVEVCCIFERFKIWKTLLAISVVACTFDSIKSGVQVINFPKDESCSVYRIINDLKNSP